MKKKIFMILLITLLINPITFVNAEEVLNNGDSQDVTVGDVETGNVYDVEFKWANLVLDWIYDGEKYRWSAGRGESGNEKNAYVEVYDKSANDDLKFLLVWNPLEKYEYTYVNFRPTSMCRLVSLEEFNPSLSFYDNQFCYGEKNNKYDEYVPNLIYDTYTDPALVDDYINEFQIENYRFCLSVDNEENPTKCTNKEYAVIIKFFVDNTKTFNIPTSGDVVGTLTLTISTDD